MMTNLVTSGNSFKVLFSSNRYSKKMSMTRQERERFVLDLYNQGKNIREIAKEARISFRDIGVILNKAVEGREQEQEGNNDAAENKNLQQQEQKQQEYLSPFTQAYKLFSDGKTPTEVAVALNLRESEVTKFYKEYWRLNQLHELNMVYEQVKGDITPFLKLYRSVKAAGMDVQAVVGLIKIANNNLPAVEHRYKRLKQEVDSLETRKLNSNMSLQDLKNQISNLRKALGSCDLTYTQQVERIAELQTKEMALEDLVRRFESNNEEYLKIKQTVKQEVSGILSDGKVLLRLALSSLIESIRNKPEKYSPLIYYNDIYGRQHLYSSQNYVIEHYTAMLVEESEKLYNKLVTDIVNRVIDDTTFSSSTLSSSSPSSPLLSSSSANAQQQKS